MRCASLDNWLEPFLGTVLRMMAQMTMNTFVSLSKAQTLGSLAARYNSFFLPSSSLFFNAAFIFPLFLGHGQAPVGCYEVDLLQLQKTMPTVSGTNRLFHFFQLSSSTSLPLSFLFFLLLLPRRCPSSFLRTSSSFLVL